MKTRRFVLFFIFFIVPLYSQQSTIGEVISIEANKYIGVPYVYGGNDFKKGIDCSAFIKGLYREHGYILPRRAKWQALNTEGCPTYTNIKDSKIGDTLYFARNEGRGEIHHVAIITGYTKSSVPIITHAKGKKFGVVREEISKRYLSELVAIKRFSECVSVLKNEFNEEELASNILYLSSKYNIDRKELYSTIYSLSDFEPLILYIRTNKRMYENLLFSKKDGIKALAGKEDNSVYLFIDNIFQAQYIAKKFYLGGIKFKAGISLSDSFLFKKEDIEDIFYPMINIEKNIINIKKCISINKTTENRRSCILD